MTKAEIVEDIAAKTGLTKKEIAEAVDMFLQTVTDALVQGKHLEIRGFGTFKVKERKARIARNPGQVLRLSKRLLREGQQQSLPSLLDLSAALQVLAHKSPAHAEAVNAFIDKREPDFGDG